MSLEQAEGPHPPPIQSEEERRAIADIVIDSTHPLPEMLAHMGDIRRMGAQVAKMRPYGFNIERADKPFVVKSPYKPSGDQPQAIAELAGTHRKRRE